jgi:hypothetical protein
MPPPPSSGVDPADPGGISDALDDLEEHVVGRRVDPPRSDDLGDEDDDADPEGGAGDRGAGTESSG